jgi:hypothetical protein
MPSLQKSLVFKEFIQAKHLILWDKIKSQNDLLITK